MATLATLTGQANARVSTSLTVDMLLPEQTDHPKFVQPYAGFSVDPYALVGGFPSEDIGLGTSSLSQARVSAVAAGSGYPSPDSAVIGSDWRFIAESQYVSPPQYWNPIEPQVGSFPYIHFINQLFGIVDPSIYPNYSYLHSRTRVSRSAYAFKGGGYGELHFDSSDTLYPSVTLAYVFVPHPGDGVFWSLFDTGVYTSGAQLNLRYHKGAIEVWTGAPNEGLLFSYECHLVPGEPVIAVFSFDVPSAQVKFAAFDRKRTSQTFSLANLTGLKLNTLLGMTVNTIGGPDYSKAPKFELMEFDIWMRALSFLEIEQAISTLAAVYAVGL